MPTASRCSAKPRPNCSASRAEIGMAPIMTNWIETYRGTVPPWECDVTEHFTIAYYFDRLAEAEPNLAHALGLGEACRGRGAAGSNELMWVLQAVPGLPRWSTVLPIAASRPARRWAWIQKSWKRTAAASRPAS